MQNTNLRFLFLAMETGAWIGITVAVFVLAIALGVVVGSIARKKVTDKRLGEIDKVTEKMLEDARVESKRKIGRAHV